MRRKGSLVRIAAIREVRTSVATFGGGVVERLDARRPAPVEGEPVFTYQMAFDDLDRELETVQEILVSAEDAHTRNRIRRFQPDAHHRGVEPPVSTTGRCRFGARWPAIYGPQRGFESRRGRRYDAAASSPALLDQVDQTIKLLREPEIELAHGDQRRPGDSRFHGR